VLTLLAQIHHHGFARLHQLAHGFMARIQHPNGGGFPAPMQLSQSPS
jgi:hypothetical protein